MISSARNHARRLIPIDRKSSVLSNLYKGDVDTLRKQSSTFQENKNIMTEASENKPEQMEKSLKENIYFNKTEKFSIADMSSKLINQKPRPETMQSQEITKPSLQLHKRLKIYTHKPLKGTRILKPDLKSTPKIDGDQVKNKIVLPTL